VLTQELPVPQLLPAYHGLEGITRVCRRTARATVSGGSLRGKKGRKLSSDGDVAKMPNRYHRQALDIKS
jgi:hypothetical protein